MGAFNATPVRFRVSIVDKDGTRIPLNPTDIIRVAIGRHNHPPIITLYSNLTTPGGSTVTLSNPTVINISDTDMGELSPGIYDIQISVLDNTQGLLTTHISYGCFTVFPGS